MCLALAKSARWLIRPRVEEDMFSSFLRQDSTARCSRQEPMKKKKRSFMQIFDLFVWTHREHALPGLLFSLLARVWCQLPRGKWQASWLIEYNYNHNTGYLHSHYWRLAFSKPSKLVFSLGVIPGERVHWVKYRKTFLMLPVYEIILCVNEKDQIMSVWSSGHLAVTVCFMSL